MSTLVTSDLINKLAPLDMKARHIVEGFIAGLHKSPYHGFSIEFAEHRPYNQGDELKHVDWKVFGKSDRLYVKQYEEETNLKAHILLDVSSSMLFKYHASWTKLQYGVHLAASLMHLMYRQRDAVGLYLFDNEIRDAFAPKATNSHVKRMYGQLEALLKLEKSKNPEPRTTNAASVLHKLASTISQRGLVIIISDLMEDQALSEPLQKALKHLRHQNHEVLVFNLIEHRSERALDVKSNRLLVKDLESNASLSIDVNQVREDYQARIKEYMFGLKIFCEQANISFEEIDTESAFEKALLAYLIKRKKLG